MSSKKKFTISDYQKQRREKRLQNALRLKLAVDGLTITQRLQRSRTRQQRVDRLHDREAREEQERSDTLRAKVAIAQAVLGTPWLQSTSSSQVRGHLYQQGR